MNITGIITEYNPFHKGHLYHLNNAKSKTNSDGVVCIMSGNFVQRGGPAIVDKWSRTEMALNNGVDLIIELPTFHAVSSAEYFAKGSISILNSLGVVNNLFFGSEHGEIDTLYSIAKTLSNEDINFKKMLKNYLNLGYNFAKCRELALKDYFDTSDFNNIISSSNNILGIEYIKSLLYFKSNIKPYTLKREGSNYNDTNVSSSFSSATSIRKLLANNNSIDDILNTIPEESFSILKKLNSNNYKFSFDEDMYSYIKFKALTNCINFNNLYEISEGLDNKILKEIITSTSYNDFILRVKSKRYTYTKISRLLTQIFIGFDNFNFDMNSIYNLNYARILGFNSTGRTILSKIKDNSTIPLITNIPKNHNNPLLELDIQATKAYSILNPKIDPKSDYFKTPIIKY